MTIINTHRSNDTFLEQKWIVIIEIELNSCGPFNNCQYFQTIHLNGSATADSHVLYTCIHKILHLHRLTPNLMNVVLSPSKK
jgi:hypothetical protein